MKVFIPSLFLWFLSACNLPGKSVQSFLSDKVVFTACNEDTVQRYTFCMLKANRFYYTIAQKNEVGKPEMKGYSGSISEFTYNGTTNFHLMFDRNRRPDSLTDFLVVEGSGNYLIQHFTNSQRVVFMRIDRLIRK